MHQLNLDEQTLFSFAGVPIETRIDELAHDFNYLSDSMIYLRPNPVDCPLRIARLTLNRALKKHGLQR